MPRWEAHSQRGMYLNQAPDCAGSVPLILNLGIRNITAQWNVVFDDWFSTVTIQADDFPDFNIDEWSQMFGTSTYYIPNPDDNEELDLTCLIPIKQVSDKSLFDKYIKQDITLSNPLTRPHQTYLDVIQQQDEMKGKEIKATN